MASDDTPYFSNLIMGTLAIVGFTFAVAAKGCAEGHKEACETYCTSIHQEMLKSQWKECWCTKGIEGTKVWGAIEK